MQDQVEFWATVERAALDNPELPASFIAESLVSMAEPREKSTVFVARSAHTKTAIKPTHSWYYAPRTPRVAAHPTPTAY